MLEALADNSHFQSVVMELVGMFGFSSDWTVTLRGPLAPGSGIF